LRVSKGEADIVFIQKPKKNDKNDKARGPSGGKTYHSSTHLLNPIRTAIWIKTEIIKQSDCILLEQYSDRDQTAVMLHIKEPSGAKRKLILCSIYLPSHDENGNFIKNPIKLALTSLINHCTSNKIELIIAGDFNAHNKVWGDKKDDGRGDKVLDFINMTNLTLLNKGSVSTFVEGEKIV
jgi:exonuclease III